MASKLRWGELEEEDGEDLDFLLPPRQVIGPDENGIKRVIEYQFGDDGNKVKITTTTRIRKLATARLNKRAVERRRSWLKFGDAVEEDDDARLTMVSTEEIVLERPKPLGSSKEGAKNIFTSALLKFNEGAVYMVCRACGKNADHWSESCPYISDERFVDIPPSLVDEPYLSWRNYKNSLRVTNLSEDTSEGDLFELFSYFGTVVRVYVDIDQETGICRGFGFVNFVSREDSQRAINKLNGYGYDSLILRVEWATPT